MTTKITAFVVSVVAAALFITGWLWPNDPYFFIISSNSAVAIVRLMLAGLLVWAVFGSNPRHAFAQYFYFGLASVLVVFGIAGMGVPNMDYALFNFVKPLDYVLIVGIGIFFGCASLSCGHGAKELLQFSFRHPPSLRLTQLRLPHLRLARLPALQLRLFIIKHVHT